MPINRNLSRREYVDAVFHPQRGGRVGYFVDWFIMTLIALNVIAVMLETVDTLYAQYGAFFFWFEVVSVTIFTVEYVARIWSITSRPGFADPIRGRIQYGSKPLMIVDLLAILPFFLGPLLPADLRFLRALRLVRFFRLLKLARYSNSMKAFTIVAKKKKPDLVIAFVATSILLVLASSIMYFIETNAHPDEFNSIPETMWWGVVTLTTVGYGDVTPVTPLGRLFGGIVAVLGIGLFGLPASILASGFIAEASSDDESNGDSPNYCPDCGYDLDEH